MPSNEVDHTSTGPLLSARGWLVVALVWLGLGLLEALKARVMAGLGGLTPSWPYVLVGNLPWWMVWGLLTPAIFALSRRWSFAGARGFRVLAVHAPAAVALSLLHLTVVAALYFRTNAAPDTVFATMWLNWLNAFGFLELFIYGTVVAVWHAVDHYRLFRERQVAAHRLEVEQERLEKEMATAELRALQMELQPHFLFNTFNAITALVRQRENRAAVEMLVRLSELLHLTLERGGSPLVPLHDEVALVRCYLGIQQVRFPELRAEIGVDDDAGRTPVPTLVLQPLVENAVKHGLAGESGGTVSVRGWRTNGHLTVVVEDSGHGAGSGRTGGRGIGLANTRARLHRLWGDRAAVHLDAVPGRGTRVTLELPVEGP